MAGTCALCQKTRELQESHLIPSALYKRLRDQSSSNPNPVVFDSKDERQTSFQAVQPLLCTECEQRFHRLGEDWTLARNARDARTFPLRELLLSETATKIHDDLQYFRTVDLPAVNADALSYFALSIAGAFGQRAPADLCQGHAEDTIIVPDSMTLWRALMTSALERKPAGARRRERSGKGTHQGQHEGFDHQSRRPSKGISLRSGFRLALQREWDLGRGC